MKLLTEKVAAQIESIIKRLGLPVRVSGVDIESVLEAMKMDKKGGTFVLIHDIGKIQSGVVITKSLVKNIVKEICV